MAPSLPMKLFCRTYSEVRGELPNPEPQILIPKLPSLLNLYLTSNFQPQTPSDPGEHCVVLAIDWCSAWTINLTGQRWFQVVRACQVASAPPTLRPVDCSSPGSSVHGILQAKLLEWVAMPPSRWPSLLRDRSRVSCGSWIAGGLVTAEPPGKPQFQGRRP